MATTCRSGTAAIVVGYYREIAAELLLQFKNRQFASGKFINNDHRFSNAVDKYSLIDQERKL
jgi:hypothetical protein